jgi:hypothetical protein
VALKAGGGPDIRPATPGEATFLRAADLPRPRRGSSRAPASKGSLALGRILILLLLLAIAGGAVFLVTWEIPAPTSPVEQVIPDARLPR